MLIRAFLCLFFIWGTFVSSFAQDYVTRAYRGTRIVNGHSLESQGKGELDLIIAHRFGRVNGGPKELFGLDQATMRIGLEYGFNDWLGAGIGRSSFEKTYDAHLKLRILRQQVEGLPVSVTYMGGIALKSAPDSDPVRDHFFTNRLYYTHQLLIGGKINEGISWQIMPTLQHRNFTESLAEKNDVFAIGIAPRIRLAKFLAMTFEYYYVLPNQLGAGYENSLGIGFDIETGGHVFQLHFTNSRGMTERFFLTETTGKWLQGDIHFGFNMSRTFKIKGRWF